MKNPRITSIDLLRGIVMILMALDHTRDYFHYGAFTNDPSNLETTTSLLFFTRFITHFCAPVFVFLAGSSAFLYGQKRTKSELSTFLWTRGLWLIFLEIVLNNLLWWFDLTYGFFNLQVLWAIGISMLMLSVLIRLPRPWILAIGLIIVLGHNLLDGVSPDPGSAFGVLWAFLHESGFYPIGGGRFLSFTYPVLPWIGLMALGYCLGKLYVPAVDPEHRRRSLRRLGLSCIALFVLLRFINVYGDPAAWSTQADWVFSTLSFFNVTKYPPSLLFLLITIGPALLFLSVAESMRTGLAKAIIVFGRVPFFYYFIHILLIHSLALIILLLRGQDYRLMIITNDLMMSGQLADYGYPLWVVYLVWLGVVMALYPLCKWFMNYKARNRDKRWLSYV